MPSLSSAKARRTAARLASVQALYQMELGDGSAPQAVYDLMMMRQDDIPEQLVEPDQFLLKAICEGVLARLDAVDELVNGALDDGRGIGRSEALLRAIYRAGAYELLSDAQTSPGIIINDYVNVAHAFFSEGEPAKINAVLDRISRNLMRDQRSTTA